MKCPSCGSNASKVTQTRREIGGTVRIRKCGDCLESYRTVEYIRGEYVRCVKKITQRTDEQRMDFIADLSQDAASLLLPSHCVEQNPHSMRAAIDQAMDEFEGEKSK